MSESQDEGRLQGSAASARRLRLLIVDDEQRFLAVLRLALGDEHDVVSALGGREALHILERDPSFDFVVCDLMMPELTGMDLHRELLHRRPDLARRLVWMTSGAFTESARAFLDTTPNARIEKPFDAPTLLRLLRSLDA